MPTYSVDALCLGRSPTPGPALLFQQEFGSWFETRFYAWLIRGGERVIMVDSGFTDVNRMNANRPPDKPMSQEPGESLVAQLAARNVRPEDVDTVILTHLHLDHCAGVALFSGAQIIMQGREWRGAVAPDHPAMTRMKFFPRDIFAYLLTEAWDRVHLVDGDAQICPGISVHLLGGHTPGLQAVIVESGKDRVVLCCDAAYLYRNIETMTPPGLITNLAEAFHALDWVRTQKGTILPGHDPEVLVRFPKGHIL